MREVVQGPGVPSPGGPYSSGVRIGNVVQTAGQVPIDPETGELVQGGVGEQVRQTLTNVSAVLAAAGASLDNVLMVRVYLTAVEHFAEMNAVYEEYFRSPRPARTTVFVGLAPGMLVEIDALAVIGA